ncbi:hypothetical protein AB0M45_29515 [Nocardia sp. NPDC051787]
MTRPVVAAAGYGGGRVCWLPLPSRRIARDADMVQKGGTQLAR